ncbi:CBS domain-containing protein [Alkalispirillum mobile]|uniref:CBS domain-containing protein n=1 Tax=Alkalispirillum mobile TaxID=85925 RepID=A0A498BXR0_9GAMM|nr:CBS domain-containing protein [Alkalispirillum mobile]RLK48584.1 CBS domain-containing protein [Alkalispirillum mobile]
MYEFVNYQVKDYMTRSPCTISPDTELRELEALFSRHDFNGVPVVDQDNTLLGVATKFDLLKAFTFQPTAMIPPYEAIMSRKVADYMTREPVTTYPDRPLTRVLQRMVEMRTKSFPVVENDQVVGVIAREDILRALEDATRAN